MQPNSLRVSRCWVAVWLPRSIGLLFASVFAISCDSAAVFTPIPTPTPDGSVLRALRIEGQLGLAATGDVTQLAAIGSYSDGTDKVVTDTASWSSDNPSVAIVSRGKVTAIALGRATISATLSGFKATAVITVTPPGTFVVSGRLREPGSGNLSGVRVTELSSGLSRDLPQSDFMLGGLVGGDLRFTKTGYEDRDLQARENDKLDVPMQKFMRLPAGDSVEAFVTPNDINYEIAPGELCDSCKRVRLETAAAGTVDLRLNWTEPHSALNVWVNGQKFSAPSASLEVSATIAVPKGETLVYVGGPIVAFSYVAPHVSFVLTASAVR